jgi:hypothetical protein
MRVTSQKVARDQTVSLEPVDQLLRSGRLRNVVQKLAQYLALVRYCVEDRVFNWLTGPAVRDVDPVPGAGNRDPLVLLHGRIRAWSAVLARTRL